MYIHLVSFKPLLAYRLKNIFMFKCFSPPQIAFTSSVLAHACHFLSSYIIDVKCIRHFKLSIAIIVAAYTLQFALIHFLSLLFTHWLTHSYTSTYAFVSVNQTIFSGFVILNLATSRVRWMSLQMKRKFKIIHST